MIFLSAKIEQVRQSHQWKPRTNKKQKHLPKTTILKYFQTMNYDNHPSAHFGVHADPRDRMGYFYQPKIKEQTNKPTNHPQDLAERLKVTEGLYLQQSSRVSQLESMLDDVLVRFRKSTTTALMTISSLEDELSVSLQTIARLTEYVTTVTGEVIDTKSLTKTRGPRRAGSIVALRHSADITIPANVNVTDLHPSLSPLKQSSMHQLDAAFAGSGGGSSSSSGNSSSSVSGSGSVNNSLTNFRKAQVPRKSSLSSHRTHKRTVSFAPSPLSSIDSTSTNPEQLVVYQESKNNESKDLQTSKPQRNPPHRPSYIGAYSNLGLGLSEESFIPAPSSSVSASIPSDTSLSRRSTLNLLFGGTNGDTDSAGTGATDNSEMNGAFAAAIDRSVPHDLVRDVSGNIDAVRKDRRSSIAMLLDGSSSEIVEDRVNSVLNRTFLNQAPTPSVQRDRRSTLAMLFGGGSTL